MIPPLPLETYPPPYLVATRVRHEAAESLGAFANTATEEILRTFTQDADPIVAHSCVVALDVLDHEKRGLPYFAGVAGAEALSV